MPSEEDIVTVHYRKNIKYLAGECLKPVWKSRVFPLEVLSWCKSVKGQERAGRGGQERRIYSHTQLATWSIDTLCWSWCHFSIIYLFWNPWDFLGWFLFWCGAVLIRHRLKRWHRLPAGWSSIVLPASTRQRWEGLRLHADWQGKSHGQNQSEQSFNKVTKT